MANSFATDGICHNANPGTFGHECGKRADFIGTKSNGWQCGFCADCKKHGFEAKGFISWEVRVPNRRTVA